MSIKGNGQTLFVGKEKITIQETLEKDKVIHYEYIRLIEYQFAEGSNYGFMRFKADKGQVFTFCFKPPANEAISRAIDYLKQNLPNIQLGECSERFTQR